MVMTTKVRMLSATLLVLLVAVAAWWLCRDSGEPAARVAVFPSNAERVAAEHGDSPRTIQPFPNRATRTEAPTPSPSATPGSWTLFGQVRMKDGTPLSGSLRMWPRGQDSIEVRIQTDGTYSVELPPVPLEGLSVKLDEIRIWVREREDFPRPPAPDSADRRVRWDHVLGRPCLLHGVVRDVTSGTPVQGVGISARDSESIEANRRSTSWITPLTLSGEDGSFSVIAIHEGQAEVWIYPKLAGGLDHPNGPGTALHEATLTREGVPEQMNALVLRPRERDTRDERWPLEAVVYVDLVSGGAVDLGTLLVGGLGTLVLVVENPGWEAGALAGNHLMVWCPVRRCWLLTLPTDQSGTTTLPYPPGRHRTPGIRIGGIGADTEPGEIELPPGGTATVRVHRHRLVSILEEMARRIHFRVTTEQGFPIKEAVISWGAIHEHTDGGGDVSFPCEERKLCADLIVTHPHFEQMLKPGFEATAGSHHELELVASNLLQLCMLDIQSKPVSRATLTWLIRVPGAAVPVQVFSAFESQGDAGVHRIGLPSTSVGELGLFVRAETGVGILWLETGTPSSREERLVLVPTVKMAGVVRNAGGLPLAGAQVVTSLPGLPVHLGQKVLTAVGETRSADDGTFSVHAVERNGTLTVLGSDRSGLRLEYRSVDEIRALVLDPPVQVTFLRPDGVEGPLIQYLAPVDSLLQFQLFHEWEADQGAWAATLPFRGSYRVQWSQDPREQHRQEVIIREDSQVVQLSL